MSTQSDLISYSRNSVADLTLSGGVYLGGTGSANYLDDYETGSWTPTLSGFAGTPTINNAYYTKVGRLVTCTLRVLLDATSDGSQMQINGFPFVTTTSGNNIYGGFVTYTNSSTTGNIYPLMDISTNVSKLYTTSGNNFTYNDLGASKDIRILYVYYTD